MVDSKMILQKLLAIRQALNLSNTATRTTRRPAGGAGKAGSEAARTSTTGGRGRHLIEFGGEVKRKAQWDFSDMKLQIHSGFEEN